jgi:hypothetical protein
MSLLKTILRPFWKASAPVRRPFARLWHESIRRAVTAALQEQAAHLAQLDGTAPALARMEEAYPPALGRIEHIVRVIAEDARVARAYVEHHGDEANVLMDSVIRELSRLQLLVEDLRERVEDAESASELESPAAMDLSVVGSPPHREVG